MATNRTDDGELIGAYGHLSTAKVRRVALARKRNRKSCSISETTTCSALRQSFGALQSELRILRANASECAACVRELVAHSASAHGTRATLCGAKTDRFVLALCDARNLLSAVQLSSGASLFDEQFVKRTKQPHCRCRGKSLGSAHGPRWVRARREQVRVALTT